MSVERRRTGSGRGREGVGRAEDDTAGLDGVFALPDHRDDGACGVGMES